MDRRRSEITTGHDEIFNVEIEVEDGGLDQSCFAEELERLNALNA